MCYISFHVHLSALIGAKNLSRRLCDTHKVRQGRCHRVPTNRLLDFLPKMKIWSLSVRTVRSAIELPNSAQETDHHQRCLARFLCDSSGPPWRKTSSRFPQGSPNVGATSLVISCTRTWRSLASIFCLLPIRFSLELRQTRFGRCRRAGIPCVRLLFFAMYSLSR